MNNFIQNKLTDTKLSQRLIKIVTITSVLRLRSIIKERLNSTIIVKRYTS